MKRFVTYLYEYDRGSRGRNVGFIRTDIRDTVCRMELHIRGLDRLKEKSPVFFVVSDDRPVGVPVGEILISQGIGNLILTFPNQQIGQSQYIIDQLQALVIRLDSGKVLAGNFLKEPAEGILTGNFDVWTPAPERMSQTTAFSEETASSKQELSRESPASEDTKSSSGRSNPSAPVFRDHIDSAASLDARNYESSLVLPDQRNHESSPVFPDQRNHEGSPVSPNQKNYDGSPDSPDLRNSNNSIGVRNSGINEVPPESSPTQGSGSPRESSSPQANDSPRETSAAHGNGNLRASSASQGSDSPWEGSSPQGNFSFQKRPTPPESNAPHPNVLQSDAPQPEVSYRRIELTDIKSLPQRNWFLSNNRFVVHGFFNYHYLILKTMMFPEGRKRFLGVPGIYEQPERMMALLFGFPEFELSEEAKCSRSQKDADLTGAFGYWMCPVAEE